MTGCHAQTFLCHPGITMSASVIYNQIIADHVSRRWWLYFVHHMICKNHHAKTVIYLTKCSWKDHLTHCGLVTTYEMPSWSLCCHCNAVLGSELHSFSLLKLSFENLNFMNQVVFGWTRMFIYHLDIDDNKTLISWNKYHLFQYECNIELAHLVPLLLTFINFNPSMDE